MGAYVGVDMAWRPTHVDRIFKIVLACAAFGLALTLLALWTGGDPAQSLYQSAVQSQLSAEAAVRPPPHPSLFYPLLKQTFDNCEADANITRNVRITAASEAYLHPFELAQVHPCCAFPEAAGDYSLSRGVPVIKSDVWAAPLTDEQPDFARRVSSALFAKPSTCSAPIQSSVRDPNVITSLRDILFVVITDPTRENIYPPVLSSGGWTHGLENVLYLSLDEAFMLQATKGAPLPKEKIIWTPADQRIRSADIGAGQFVPPTALTSTLAPIIPLHVVVPFLHQAVGSIRCYLQNPVESYVPFRWIVLVDDRTWVSPQTLVKQLRQFQRPWSCPIALSDISTSVPESPNTPRTSSGVALSWSAYVAVLNEISGGVSSSKTADAPESAPSTSKLCSYYVDSDTSLSRCLWGARVQLVHGEAFGRDADISFGHDRLHKRPLPRLFGIATAGSFSPADHLLSTMYVDSRMRFAAKAFPFDIRRNDTRSGVEILRIELPSSKSMAMIAKGGDNGILTFGNFKAVVTPVSIRRVGKLGSLRTESQVAESLLDSIGIPEGERRIPTENISSLSPSEAASRLASNPLTPEIMVPDHFEPKGKLRRHAIRGYSQLHMPYPPDERATIALRIKELKKNKYKK